MEVETYINKSSIVKRCCSLIIGTLYWKRRKSIEILTNSTVDEDFSFFGKDPRLISLESETWREQYPKSLPLFSAKWSLFLLKCVYFYFLLMKLLLRRFLLFLLKKAEAYFTLCNDIMLCFYGL